MIVMIVMSQPCGLRGGFLTRPNEYSRSDKGKAIGCYLWQWISLSIPSFRARKGVKGVKVESDDQDRTPAQFPTYCLCAAARKSDGSRFAEWRQPRLSTPASEISFPSPLLYHLLFLLLPHTLLPTIDASFRHLTCRLGRACCNSIREEQNKAHPRRTPTNAIKSDPVRVDRYSTLLAQCFGVARPLIPPHGLVED
ncbi:uncharacterized protein UBRO_20883 [Ustilago bromivora]|uniref:Uncharacterized protein n=1 Tax=Ustilago bromivora TaxID=307758 RepID=A0A1K0GB39_9BASI|nr:uncharacterized protein UBRO_20883 [Ustilago bromivora]